MKNLPYEGQVEVRWGAVTNKQYYEVPGAGKETFHAEIHHRRGAGDPKSTKPALPRGEDGLGVRAPGWRTGAWGQFTRRVAISVQGPTFHDAEVRSLHLDRTSVLFEDIADVRLDLCLHAFEWTRSANPTLNHHLVQFRFHDVDELALEGFNHQNAILEFKIEDYVGHTDTPVGFKLTFVPTHGLAGCFFASSGDVLAVIPCDEKGRPRQKAEPIAPPNSHGLDTLTSMDDLPARGCR